MRWVGLLVVGVLAAGCMDIGARVVPDGGPAWTSARALVWSWPPKLVVEVDFLPGREPTKTALDNLVAQLRNVTAKKEIELVVEPIGLERDWGGPDRLWTTSEVAAVADEVSSTGGQLVVNDTAYLHLVFLNGYAETEAEGGYRISGFSAERFVVIFPDDLRRDTELGVVLPVGPDPRHVLIYEKAERWLVIHEVGHSLGLIGVGAPVQTPRASDRNPVHSEERESPMYELDRSGNSYLDDFSEDKQAPYVFSENDLADLRALLALEPEGFGRA